MLKNYDKFAARLEDPLIDETERQIISASLVMLKEMMRDKTRDVRRRLRESQDY